jgi:signal transduction histidine kinase
MHEAYFTIVPMTTPFAHLGIQPGPLYWIMNALAYGLSLGGYLMLAPLLWRAGSARAPLVALVGVTALPLVLNAAGALTPLLLGVNHDALGVACFAVGVLFAYTGYFQDVQPFSGQDGPALTVDRHGRIRTYNTAAQNLFSALREGEATGKPLRAVLPEVAAASEGEGEARVFRHPADAAGPTDAAYYQVTASRFGAGLDQPGRLLVISDVTPLQAAKEKAEAAQRAAEAANRLKSQFLAGVAHDLCSPLTSIVGFADVLKEELAIPHQARQAAMIEQAGRRIEKMADQILDLARMEAGSLRLDLAPCDVCRVAEDVVHTAQDDARHAGIDLVLDVPLAPAMALADEEALRRVIDNLIRNAIKYGSAGDGVRVWVRQARPGVATLGDVYEAMGRPWTRRAAEVATGAAFSLDADEAVVLAVEDTGPGIDPAFLERLFEPFARNAPGTEGTGLGLAVTKELVARMGGCIHVCSKEGTGTCFRVRLPAAT